MDTFHLNYQQEHPLVFGIFESNHNIEGLPSIVIYADNYFHSKIPYLFRSIEYIKTSAELKFDTDYVFVLRHELYEKPEIDRNLETICNNLNTLDYIELTPKTN